MCISYTLNTSIQLQYLYTNTVTLGYSCKQLTRFIYIYQIYTETLEQAKKTNIKLTSVLVTITI